MITLLTAMIISTAGIWENPLTRDNTLINRLINRSLIYGKRYRIEICEVNYGII